MCGKNPEYLYVLSEKSNVRFHKGVHIADWGLLGWMDLPHSSGSHSAFSGEDDNPLTFRKESMMPEN